MDTIRRTQSDGDSQTVTVRWTQTDTDQQPGG